MTESGQQTTALVGHSRGSSAYRRVLIALGAVGMTTFALLYYPQATIPAISRDLDVTVADAALTISAATIGLAAAVLGWSWVANRFGRTRVIKLALLAAVALGFLIPFAPSFELLVATRVLQGVALGGTPALALTYLAEEVDPRDAMVASGTYISGTVIGGLAGRLVAAPVADVTDWRIGGLVVTALSALGALLAVVLLPNARNFRPATGGQQRVVRDGVAASLRNPALLILYAQAALLCGGHVAVFNYLGYRLEQPPFSLAPTLSAGIFLAGLSGAVSARAAGRLAARFGRRPVLLSSAATMATGAALTIPDWLPTVLFGLLMLTVGYFGAHSIASGWVSPNAISGTAQANSLYSLFYYVGSSVFGWLGGLAFSAGWAGTAIMVISIVSIALGCACLHPLSNQQRAETPSAGKFSGTYPRSRCQ